MEIEIKIISRETIKPSSPTPKSLQKHNLSFLDQLAPPFFMPLVYFYSSSPSISNSEKSDHLKKSLSEILSRFYPLAGRLVGNSYVDCNDGGAPFVEAEAKCDLSEVIADPEPKNMHGFLPCKMNEDHDFCMAVQATYFRCGGVAVGLMISHKLADASSFFLFANAWSAVARNGGGGGVPMPVFDGAVHFPPQHDIPGYNSSMRMIKEDLISTKIFKFPSSKINVLRERYSINDDNGGPQRRPTRVAALSAFIWTRFISATATKTDLNKIHLVPHAINLRNRVDPPLSEYHFGNINWFAIAKVEAGDDGIEVLQKVNEAVKCINGGYVDRLKEGEKQLGLIKERMTHASNHELVCFSFTSLCGFPVYEADFGWGKPVWTGTPGFAYKNVAMFFDAKSGGGIEVLVHLTKEDMVKFEADVDMQAMIQE